MSIAIIQNTNVLLSDPDPMPEVRQFIGRQRELNLCRAAWGLAGDQGPLTTDLFRLHFRLQGAPGVGKNEIVYELVRQVAKQHQLPFYMLQGHEEFTPEDLALVLVPDSGTSSTSKVPLVLRASPLASALYEGGLFFFDEINRVPERALAPLASVLDSRQYLYSSLAGLHIRPKNDEARRTFRFCCALNPQMAESGRGVLPEYIEQRTLPVIHVGYPEFEELCQIIKGNLNVKDESPLLKEFVEWYQQLDRKEVSVREALSLMMFVSNYGGSIHGTGNTILGRDLRLGD
jgi:MoxR-like ATPase